jgi:hypothetical protein
MIDADRFEEAQDMSILLNPLKDREFMRKPLAQPTALVCYHLESNGNSPLEIVCLIDRPDPAPAQKPFNPVATIQKSSRTQRGKTRQKHRRGKTDHVILKNLGRLHASLKECFPGHQGMTS